MNIIAKFLSELKIAEEKFTKIQENPAMYGAENGLTAHELEILEKSIEQVGAASLAADGISKRFIGSGEFGGKKK